MKKIIKKNVKRYNRHFKFFWTKNTENLDFGPSMQVENFLDRIQKILQTTMTKFVVLSTKNNTMNTPG